jgi:mono/diheme cytochrome c family protein
MKRGIVGAILVLSPALVLAWPWSQDMMNQPSIKPQETDNGKLYGYPARSVPTTGIPTKVANRDEAAKLGNPIAATPESLKTGERLFKVYCAACHGLTGKADSPVSGKIGAIDLTTEYVQQQLTEGWIFGTITFGSAIMPAYGKPSEGGGSNDLSVEERWHVVNYVRNALAKASAPAVAQAANK